MQNINFMVFPKYTLWVHHAKKINLVGVLGAKKTAKMFFIKSFAKLSLNFNSNLVWRWDVYILN